MEVKAALASSAEDWVKTTTTKNKTPPLITAKITLSVGRDAGWIERGRLWRRLVDEEDLQTSTVETPERSSRDQKKNRGQHLTSTTQLEEKLEEKRSKPNVVGLLRTSTKTR